MGGEGGSLDLPFFRSTLPPRTFAIARVIVGVVIVLYPAKCESILRLDVVAQQQTLVAYVELAIGDDGMRPSW